MKILKFGGTTLGTPERINHCGKIILSELPANILIVVSAMGKTTEALKNAARTALEGSVETSVIRDFHAQQITSLGLSFSTVEPLLSELDSRLRGVSLLSELTPRSRDLICSFGERLSARIVAAYLKNLGIMARAIDAFDIGLCTQGNHGNARPVSACADRIRESLSGIGCIPVITGYIGRNCNGDVTTLGRSGSDLSATFLSTCLNAEEVIIYKDVDGVMTADPSVDPRAENIPEMSFAEAGELAYFGAQVLHPDCLLPAMEHDIPVRVINAFNPRDPGTVIRSQSVHTDRIAKSVVYKEDVTVFTIRGSRRNGGGRFIQRVLDGLDQSDVVPHILSATETGLSIVSQSTLPEKGRKQAYEFLSAIAPTTCETGIAIVSVVGEELAGAGHTVVRLMSRLVESGIHTSVITRSAQGISLSMTARNKDIPGAVRTLHDEILKS